MPDAGTFPNYQNDPAASTPVVLVQKGAFLTGAPYVATPLGYQQLTSLSTATPLTVPAGAAYCYIAVEGNGVRYCDDGTIPTATSGMVLPVNTSNFLYSGNLAALLFIQQSGAAATVDVAFYN